MPARWRGCGHSEGLHPAAQEDKQGSVLRMLRGRNASGAGKLRPAGYDDIAFERVTIPDDAMRLIFARSAVVVAGAK